MAPARLAHLRELGKEWVGDGVAQTAVLLVARRGRIVFHEAYGRLTPDADAPSTPVDALFPIASLTKVITATAVMILVEEGRVGLNRPVSEYIPEFRGAGKEGVLLRHLLTHTSGVEEETLEKFVKEHSGLALGPRQDPTLPPRLHAYLAPRYEAPLAKPPGAEMSYASFNFELVGEVVRRVGRAPLDRFVRDRILRPLGMDDTYLVRRDAPQARRVRRATPLPGLAAEESDSAVEVEGLYWGAGSALSTARDLATFGQMFLNRGAYGDARILSPASVAAMTRNQIPGIGSRYLQEVFPEASWGFGWGVHGSKNDLVGGLYSPEAFEHSGSGGVFFWVDPPHELVGVYLSAAPVMESVAHWFRHYRRDLFMDVVTAAIDAPEGSREPTPMTSERRLCPKCPFCPKTRESARKS